MASETSPTWAALQQVMDRNEDQSTIQANLRKSFENLGRKNHYASTSTKGRQKRAVSQLKAIHNNTTKKTNGAVVVAFALMGYTTLASKQSFEQGVLLSWYEAKKETQFVQGACEAYASSTKDFDKLFKRTEAAAQLQTHMQTVLAEDLTTSSNPPQTQRPSDPLQDVHTSGHSPHTQTQPKPTQDLHTSIASPHTQTQPEPTQDLNTSSDPPHTQTSLQDLHTSGLVVSTSAQVLSSGTSPHTHTRPKPTREPDTLSNPQTHAQPDVGVLTVVPITLPTFILLVQSFEGSALQPECVFLGTQMTGFRFTIDNVEVGLWHMTGGLQTFSQTGIFDLISPNETS